MLAKILKCFGKRQLLTFYNQNKHNYGLKKIYTYLGLNKKHYPAALNCSRKWSKLNKHFSRLAVLTQRSPRHSLNGPEDSFFSPSGWNSHSQKDEML